MILAPKGQPAMNLVQKKATNHTHIYLRNLPEGPKTGQKPKTPQRPRIFWPKASINQVIYISRRL